MSGMRARTRRHPAAGRRVRRGYTTVLTALVLAVLLILTAVLASVNIAARSALSGNDTRYAARVLVHELTVQDARLLARTGTPTGRWLAPPVPGTPGLRDCPTVGGHHGCGRLLGTTVDAGRITARWQAVPDCGSAGCASDPVTVTVTYQVGTPVLLADTR